jgi:multidrug resistance efflux pump
LLMRRRLPLVRTLLALSAALTLAVALVLFVAHIDRVVVAPGHLAGGSVAIRAPIDGRVGQVLVEQGETVRVGQELVRLETDALEAERDQFEARIEVLREKARALRAEAEHLLDEAHPAALQQASRVLDRAKLKVDVAQKRADMMRPLESEGLVSTLEFDLAELEFALAEVALEEARDATPSLESEHRAQLERIDADMREMQGRLREEAAIRDDILRRLRASMIVATAEGIVIGSHLAEFAGQSVVRGDSILRIALGTPDRFEGTVGDTGRSTVRVGQDVKVRLEGYPWLIHGHLRGKVAFVSDRRDEGGGFGVVIDIDGQTAPGPLHEGLRGSARIVVEADVSIGRLLFEDLVKTTAP